MNATRHPRQGIYYWKCDRPAAFHGLHGHERLPVDGPLARDLASALERFFGESRIELRPAAGQGNHATFLATVAGREGFIRVEDGPDGDDNMEVEAEVLRQVAQRGVPVPEVLGVDATRTKVPFAWQVLERVPHPDLNQHLKGGRMRLVDVAPEIGACIARWQSIAPAGFGPFDITALRAGRGLNGYHASYPVYFHTRLEEHLRFLASREFLPAAHAGEILTEVGRHGALLAAIRSGVAERTDFPKEIPGRAGAPAAEYSRSAGGGAVPKSPDAREQGVSGCLVHKDLALWNILGSPDRIAAFIDWDDAIGGDPMDDISLLACFHDGAVIGSVMDGYSNVRALPSEYRRRFWLHLLRNMIWKAVIRVGAGYFDRDSGFYLVGSGQSGAQLREFTLKRIASAVHGLRTDADPNSL